MWDWIDNTIDTVGDYVNDAVDTVNNWVDKYVYDSGDGQAVVEKWVSDTVDTYIWDTGQDEAYLESWVTSTVTPVVEDVKDKVDKTVDDITNTVNNYYYTTVDKVKTVIDDAGDYINDVADAANRAYDSFLSSGKRIVETFTHVFAGLMDSISTKLGLPLLDMVTATAGIFTTLSDIGELIDSFINIDEEKLIQGAIDMTKVQQRITTELAKLVK